MELPSEINMDDGDDDDAIDGDERDDIKETLASSGLEALALLLENLFQYHPCQSHHSD